MMAGITATAVSAQAPTPIGRWDITVSPASPAPPFPSWLEVRLSGVKTLVGRFVGQYGSARPISHVFFDGTAMHFTIPPQWDAGADLRFNATLRHDSLIGAMVDAAGHTMPWIGVRAPLLHAAEHVTWGKPVALFNHRDLAGWTPSGATNQWKVINGVLTSPRPASNLITTQKFRDFKLHVEFRYPADGNSGVYLRGRYEVQVEDTRGQEPADDHLASIYGFLVPSEEAGLPPGVWQTFDITLVGRMVTVVLNGHQVICNQSIPGITGGALDSDEGAPGPIMLQGDHTSIEYRNVVIQAGQ
jgi:hypothetical protein